MSVSPTREQVSVLLSDLAKVQECYHSNPNQDLRGCSWEKEGQLRFGVERNKAVGGRKKVQIEEAEAVTRSRESFTKVAECVNSSLERMTDGELEELKLTDWDGIKEGIKLLSKNYGRCEHGDGLTNIYILAGALDKLRDEVLFSGEVLSLEEVAKSAQPLFFRQEVINEVPENRRCGTTGQLEFHIVGDATHRRGTTEIGMYNRVDSLSRMNARYSVQKAVCERLKGADIPKEKLKAMAELIFARMLEKNRSLLNEVAILTQQCRDSDDLIWQALLEPFLFVLFVKGVEEEKVKRVFTESFQNLIEGYYEDAEEELKRYVDEVLKLGSSNPSEGASHEVKEQIRTEILKRFTKERLPITKNTLETAMREVARGQTRSSGSDIGDSLFPREEVLALEAEGIELQSIG